MFRGSLQLGAIRGIPIRMHFTWLIHGLNPTMTLLATPTSRLWELSWDTTPQEV
jgi:hypothetical protein